MAGEPFLYEFPLRVLWVMNHQISTIQIKSVSFRQLCQGLHVHFDSKNMATVQLPLGQQTDLGRSKSSKTTHQFEVLCHCTKFQPCKPPTSSAMAATAKAPFSCPVKPLSWLWSLLDWQQWISTCILHIHIQRNVDWFVFSSVIFAQVFLNHNQANANWIPIQIKWVQKQNMSKNASAWQESFNWWGAERFNVQQPNTQIIFFERPQRPPVKFLANERKCISVPSSSLEHNPGNTLHSTMTGPTQT